MYGNRNRESRYSTERREWNTDDAFSIPQMRHFEKREREAAKAAEAEKEMSVDLQEKPRKVRVAFVFHDCTCMRVVWSSRSSCGPAARCA